MFSNNKPLFINLEIKLKPKEEAFKSGDRALCKKAKYDVKRAIGAVKTD